ncbi:hypothetical protein BDM02DRAFT_472431 [Thelephora ganbajun]|uniref:Uncharacterized protein n=1 Tax=Thelephora ganbajun TaxID=370292 RepID=A0ACB6Z7T1_THEGA|nr:hypothetical protein BDM02DRAFT_472431 [Thelephora ganbajun]
MSRARIMAGARNSPFPRRQPDHHRSPSSPPALNEPSSGTTRRDSQLSTIGRQAGSTVAAKSFVSRAIVSKLQPKTLAVKRHPACERRVIAARLFTILCHRHHTTADCSVAGVSCRCSLGLSAVPPPTSVPLLILHAHLARHFSAGRDVLSSSTHPLAIVPQLLQRHD